MAISQPTIIPEPWASQGSRTTIPDVTGESGRASWSLGFPPETALPLGSGGIPPHWLDFQGVLYAISNHAFFKQSGGRYIWSSSLDYPTGACIIGSDGKVYQALQNSGPGYSAGAKNPTTAGNSAYWGVLATPDGSSIVVNGSGKLAVSATNIASQLADGTTITASGGKLSAVNQGGDASALADGETIVVNNGKLAVNYGSGLDYDSQTGKLAVSATSVASQLADGTTITASGGKLTAQVPDPMPVGSIIISARKTPPSGYLACDGSAVSRSTYSDLFSAIGTTYGTGDGTSTFNLPDLVDKFAQGGTSGSTGSVGTAVAAGLPNISGGHLRLLDPGSLETVTGGPWTVSVQSSAWDLGGAGTGTPDNNYDMDIDFNAADANPIYGASSTVQPPALKLLYCIKY